MKKNLQALSVAFSCTWIFKVSCLKCTSVKACTCSEGAPACAMRLKSLLQRCSISCDVMQNISPRSDLHARALVVIQSCRFVHINSLLQMHETDTRKTRPDQPFFSHASVAMHRCTVASFYDKWLELYFGVVLFLIFFSFLCNQALKLCNDKHIFGVGNFFFFLISLVACILARAAVASPPRPFYSLSSSRRLRGGARIQSGC